jgi:hypothetical protein
MCNHNHAELAVFALWEPYPNGDWNETLEKIQLEQQA